MKSALTAVVLTHNNQNIITRCLKSLSFCSEVLVIDNFSTDSTIQIAKSLKVKVIQHKLNDDWAAQRNFALTKADHRWVLFVDSDELITPLLKKEIIFTLNNPTFHGYLLHRTDVFMNKTLRYGETGNVQLLRLADKKFGKWMRPVHETWKIKGPVGHLRKPLVHERHLTLTNFITRLNHYTSLETFDFHWIDLSKPRLKFIVNYFLRLGFLDGFPGFIMAYMMSLNSLITRVKSWENSHR